MAAKKSSLTKRNGVESGKLIPPDGGWGWVVMIAYALNNIVMIPMIYGMTLIFKDLFPALGFSPQGISILLNTNMAFGMGMGWTHGPLIKIFGYRKVAVAGCIIFTSGILITAFATEFSHLMISYGLMTSFGISLALSSFSMAMNTYFLEKRGPAFGFASTIMGMGPIFLPQIIRILMEIYTNQGTIIILGAITLHCFAASLVLQPIKWHAKRPVDEPKDNEDLEREIANLEDQNPDAMIMDTSERKRTISVTSLNGDIQNKSLATVQITEEIKKSQLIFVRRDSVTSLPNGKSSIRFSPSVNDIQAPGHRKTNNSNKLQSSGKSLDTINLGSCPMIFDDSIPYGTIPVNNQFDKNEKQDENIREEEEKMLHTEKESKAKLKKSKGGCNGFWQQTVQFFDLTLLCDPIYFNMMLGTSIATFAEMNFSVLTPFILKEMEFDTSQITTVMTTMAAVDLPMRGIAPFVGRGLRKSPRVMYLISLVMLVASRTTLIFCRSFVSVILMAIGLGFARGFRSVFMSLIAPSYIPIERLAHATGIQMVINAIVLIALGPVLGIIRQNQGSYKPCIILVNLMTLVTVLMWTIEMIIVRRIQKRKELQNCLTLNIKP